jgi:hypothetical protein
MDVKQTLESAGKFVTVLTDACKLAVLATLSTFAIAALVLPNWAKERLREVGLSVKEVNAFGVKLVANEAFDTANALADTRIALEGFRTELGATAAEPGHPVAKALAALDKAESSLLAQGGQLQEVLRSSGVAMPPLPDAGWLYIGRLAQGGGWTAGPRIDAAGTRLDGERVTRVQLRADAAVLQNGDECTRSKLEEIHPPTDAERQTLQLLLAPNATRPLEVLATATCPSAGQGKWVYAKVRIPKDDVKFTKFEALLQR